VTKWPSYRNRYNALATARPNVSGENTYYLNDGHIAAKRLFMRDFIQEIKNRAPERLDDTVFAFDPQNECLFFVASAPFSLSSGTVTLANGVTYDLSQSNAKSRMADEMAVYWMNQMAEEIKQQAPGALVNFNTFCYFGINRSIGNFTIFGNWRDRYPFRPELLANSGADMLDLHFYTKDLAHLQNELNSIQFPATANAWANAGKPMMIGEIGAYKSDFPNIANAAAWKVSELGHLEDYGFQGWLYWTYYNDIQTEFWHAVSGNREIMNALGNATSTYGNSLRKGPHTLTYQTGANGSVTGLLSQIVYHGRDGQPVTAVANEGYHFVAWSDGNMENPRTDTIVLTNVNVSARFAPENIQPLVSTGAGWQPASTTSAWLRGVLTAGEPADVWICWGSMDGGTSSTSNWDQVVSVGRVLEGVSFSSFVTGLVTNATYVYRTYAQNPYGAAWSDTVELFSGAPVNNGGNWTPALLGTKLATWLDATDGSTLWANTAGTTPAPWAGGSKVARWDDKSGRGFHQLQGTDSNRPLYEGHTINGVRALRFDTWHFMQASANAFGSSISNAMIAVVYRLNATNVDGTLFLLSANEGTAQAHRWQSHAPWSNNQMSFDVGGAASPQRLTSSSWATVDVPIMASWYSSATASLKQVHKNGTLVAGNNTANSVNTAGGILINSASGQNCTVGEVVILNGTVSEQERQKLEGYLAHKWQMTATLPAEHPYKYIAPTFFQAISSKQPTAIGETNATLHADLDATGTNFAVTVYYGPSDGGTNAGAWAESASLGSWTNVTTNLNHTVSGLTAGTQYYYTFMASNATHVIWSGPSWSFQTRSPAPAVTVNHAVPHAWLISINPDWADDFEAAVLDDPDGDGIPTWQEYLMGTNPLDPESYPKIDAITFDGSNIVLQWQSAVVAPGLPPLLIQATTNLQGGSWSNIGQRSLSNGLNTWSNAGTQQRFFRLAVTNEP
jgi:hypothetical protein